MDIRRATADDLDSLLSLQREVQELHVAAHPEIYRAPVDEELRGAMRETFERADTTVFLAVESATPLGFAVVVLEERLENAFRFAARVAHVNQLVVLASARRRGVGKALVAGIHDFARREGCENLELDVLAFNEGAQKFYLANGFETSRHRMVRYLD